MSQITAIKDLPEVHAVASGDAFPLNSSEADATRRVALSVITAYILTQMQPLSGLTRQAAAPALSPFTTNVTPAEDGASVRLILKPTGTMAVGTINLPDQDHAKDGQTVWVSCTQIVTALTVSAGTLNVVGAPTTLATVNNFFRMMYDAVDLTWYRV